MLPGDTTRPSSWNRTRSIDRPAMFSIAAKRVRAGQDRRGETEYVREKARRSVRQNIGEQIAALIPDVPGTQQTENRPAGIEAPALRKREQPALNDEDGPRQQDDDKGAARPGP